MTQTLYLTPVLSLVGICLCHCHIFPVIVSSDLIVESGRPLINSLCARIDQDNPRSVTWQVYKNTPLKFNALIIYT